MIKIKVTEKLIQVIKEGRIRQNLSARQLCEKLGKSVSYISALERKKIEFLDNEMFLKIFKAISNEEIEFDDFMNNLIKNFMFTNNLKINDLENEKWLLEYYLIIRECNVDENMIDFINTTLENLNMPKKDFAERINENRHLEMDNIYPERLLLSIKIYEVSWYYKINITEEFINELLSGKIKKISYVYMFIIIYSLFSFDMDFDSEIEEATFQLLHDNDFYELKDIIKEEITKSNTSTHKKNLYLIDMPGEYFDKLEELERHIGTFVKNINKIRGIDQIDYSIKSLQSINDNFDMDFNFMIALASLPFSNSNFKYLDFTERQQCLFEINKLINNIVKENKLSKK